MYVPKLSINYLINVHEAKQLWDENNKLLSRAKTAEPDKVFSCICSNKFEVFFSLNVILPYT